MGYTGSPNTVGLKRGGGASLQRSNRLYTYIPCAALHALFCKDSLAAAAILILPVSTRYSLVGSEAVRQHQPLNLRPPRFSEPLDSSSPINGPRRNPRWPSLRTPRLFCSRASLMRCHSDRRLFIIASRAVGVGVVRGTPGVEGLRWVGVEVPAADHMNPKNTFATTALGNESSIKRRYDFDVSCFLAFYFSPYNPTPTHPLRSVYLHAYAVRLPLSHLNARNYDNY